MAELQYISQNGKLNITRDGNVGIGTNDPSYKLQVSNGTHDFSVNPHAAGIDLHSTGNFAPHYQTNFDWYTGTIGLGVFKMRLTSGGSLGIGTTDPQSLIHLSKPTTGDANRDTATAGITLTRYVSGTDFRGSSIFHAYQDIGGNDKELLAFAVGGGNSGTPFDFSKTKMVVTEVGNVGIGTHSPTAKLNVIGDVHIGNYTDTNDKNLELRTPSSILAVNTSASAAVGTKITYSWANGGQGPLKINNAGGEVMRIDSSGNVGIGTTSPSSFYPGSNNLVVGSGTGDKAITVYAGNTSTAYYLFAKGTTGVDRYHGQVRYNFNADTMEFTAGGSTSSKFTIKSTGVLQVPSLGQGFLQTDSSGNISTSGGGTLPGGPYLPLSGGTLTGQLTFPYGFLGDYIYHTGNSSAYFGFSANDTFQINTGGSERLRVTSTGSVGIGITSPGEKLEVNGNIKIKSALLSNQENTNIDAATSPELVAQVAIATYTAAFFDFVVKKGTNVRSGTVYACNDGTNVEFTETSTQDLGDTSDVVLSVDISGGNMRLLATVASDDWSVKSLVKAI